MCFSTVTVSCNSVKNDTDVVQCDSCSTVGFTTRDFCPQYMNIAGHVACMHCLLSPRIQTGCM